MIGILPALALAAASPVQAGPEEALPEPITIGEAYSFDALDAARQVNVILPPAYEAEPDRTWPVIYMLDGGMVQDIAMGIGIARWNAMWGRSADAIIVGLETKDRQRELLPPTQDAAEAARYPAAGESDRFRQWIAQQVKPLIESRYRHNGTAVLVGESAAGHFVMETWADAPGMFDGYAAISPSLQWDWESLSRRLAKAGASPRPRLYLSLADEGGATETGMERALAAMGEGQAYCFSDRREDLRHATSLHGLLPEALQYLLPTEADWLDEYGLTLRCDRQGQAAD